jgi:hypothetical protein
LHEKKRRKGYLQEDQSTMQVHGGEGDQASNILPLGWTYKVGGDKGISRKPGYNVLIVSQLSSLRQLWELVSRISNSSYARDESKMVATKQFPPCGKADQRLEFFHPGNTLADKQCLD